MGKASAMWGKTSGKVGGLVYATSGGEQIVREYNPTVANPSTDAQVNQRAKMKLMSQLAACLAPSLAIVKDGLISARNKFTKRNFNYADAVNGVAQVSYENLQLTEGNLALPQLVGGKMQNQETGLSTYQWGFATTPSENLTRVVFSLFQKTDEGRLALLESAIVNRGTYAVPSGWSDQFIYVPSTLTTAQLEGLELVIYAYGMVDANERATARYGNLNVQTGTDIARLVANRSISFTDYQFTQTRGATVGANGTPIEPTPAGSVRIFATATNGGTVSGGGTYEIGQTATLTATPDAGYEFVKWTLNGGGDYATRNPVTINVQSQLDLVANFRYVGNDSL